MATHDITVNISATTTAEITKHINRVIAEAQAGATIDQLAKWLNVDFNTALDWCVAKVAAFRGVSDSEAAQMIGIQPD